jgi:BioD-like phosphotransacetylase family protein
LGVLYVVSVEEAAGKTAICAGLARNLMSDGKKVGYLKPQATGKDGSDSDVVFMKQVTGLTDVVNAPDVIQGRDVVLVENRLGPSADDASTKDSCGAAREMKARVIAVEAYPGEGTKYAEIYKSFGDNLLGVVINKVPESQLKQVKEDTDKQLTTAGIELLGVIPENRAVLAITVNELAESVRGEILNSTDKADELVENYMLGALVVDSGLDYFGRKNNKAAIIRQDRPDMQLAALETSTRCIVLSGSKEAPMYNVLQKAENQGIPMIATDAAAIDIIASIEEALSKSRISQEKKLTKLADIVKRGIDPAAVV